jgi:hypothetical protein
VGKVVGWARVAAQRSLKRRLQRQTSHFSPGRALQSRFKPLRQQKAVTLTAVALSGQMSQRRMSRVARIRRRAFWVWRLKTKQNKMQQAIRRMTYQALSTRAAAG